MTHTRLIGAFVILLAWASLSSAFTYYVRPNGTASSCVANTDTAAGSRNTIASGVACLASGDTLIIHGGTYNEKIGADFGSRIPDGSLSNYTKIWAYPGNCGVNTCETVNMLRLNVDGSFVEVDGTHHDGQYSEQVVVGNGDHHNRFKNMEVKNGTFRGFCCGNNGSNEYLNNYIHNIADQSDNQCSGEGLYHGIYYGGGNNVIDGNRIHNIRNGYGAQSSINHSGDILRNNIVHNSALGLLVYGSNHLVYNNVVYNNNGTPQRCCNGAIVCFSCGGGTKFYNNTVYGNAGSGIYIDGSGNEIINNILWENGLQVTGSNTCDHNNSNRSLGVCTSTITGTPNVVDARGDFHLQAGSPAVDVGVNLSSVFNSDRDGVSRTQGRAWDIGAYAFRRTIPPPPIGPPTRFKVTAFTSGSVTLAWDAVTGASGYRLHYGSASRTYTSTLDVGTVTTATITGMSTAAFTYYAIGAKDSSGSKGPLSQEAISPVPGAKVVAVDAGGVGLTDWNSVVWSADTGFTGGNVGSNLGTTVAGAYTTEQALFQTRRISLNGTGPSYAFSVTNGTYLVTLKFAEMVFNAAGQRVFNIAMEGTTVDSNVDVLARAGGQRIAYDKSYVVHVTDGQLNIAFSVVTQDTQVSGILVRPGAINGAPTLVGQGR